MTNTSAGQPGILPGVDDQVTRDDRGSAPGRRIDSASLDHTPGPESLPAGSGGTAATAGTTIDRFEILELLGTGGMGEVFRAYDPKLGRDVALKLLRPTGDTMAEARLRREAQAMARLTHPNILPIFDVGGYDERVFIAMQLVEGQTLRQWLQEGATRAFPEILRVFLAAGRGLQAAHNAELVHRDFKPSNVMIGRGGEVLVMDFGLARTAGDLPDSDGIHADASPTYDEALTRSDVVVGTPAYMAPEQHMSKVIDPRSDQYAFCVALWEAVHGKRPFAGPTLVELVQAKLTRAPTLVSGGTVPPWLVEALLRGMLPEPNDRFESMKALLDVLEQGSSVSHRRRTIAGAVGMLGLGALGLWALMPATQVRCQGGRDRLAGIWDIDTARQLEASLLATERSYASETWERLRPVLDDYADRWVAAHNDACESGQHESELAESLMDARMRCLDERRRQLGALVKTASAANAQAVKDVLPAARTLPDLVGCEQPSHEQARTPLPEDPELRVQVESLVDALAEVRAAQALGAYDDALVRALEIHGRAEALGYAPLVIEATLRVGRLQDATAAYNEAATWLSRAYFDAQREELAAIETEAAVALVHLHGARLADPEEGLRWGKHAQASVERGGDERLRGALETSLGSLRRHQDEYELALEHHERALEIWAREVDPLDPRVTRTLSNIGTVYTDQARFEEALEVHQRVLDLRERALGPGHPAIGTTLANMGTTYRAMGRHDEALDLYQRALKIRERALGPDHLAVAATAGNIGVVHGAKGEFDLALPYFERVVAVQQRAEPDHPRVARSFVNLGNVYGLQGHYERALASFEKSLEIWEQALGPDNRNVAMCLNNMSAMYRVLGRHDEALAATQRALAIEQARLGPEHPQLVGSIDNLGRLYLQQGDYARALEWFRRGLTIAESAYGPKHHWVGVMFANIGRAQRQLGELTEAESMLRRSIPLLEAALTATHANVGSAALGLGGVLMDQGRPVEAVVEFERAVSILDVANAPPEQRAAARFALARALGRRATRAKTLAVSAREAYAEAEGEHADAIAEIEAWLGHDGG